MRSVTGNSNSLEALSPTLEKHLFVGRLEKKRQTPSFCMAWARVPKLVTLSKCQQGSKLLYMVNHMHVGGLLALLISSFPASISGLYLCLQGFALSVCRQGKCNIACRSSSFDTRRAESSSWTYCSSSSNTTASLGSPALCAFLISVLTYSAANFQLCKQYFDHETQCSCNLLTEIRRRIISSLCFSSGIDAGSSSYCVFIDSR
jgi:hypothetical protein